MIEKVGHVRNPLTVIAIFAGLAEVSGTVVLPFLDKATQQVYVWFLMGFPCLLVSLFFWMLYAKHQVLYAPSDFKDDKTFLDLFDGPKGDRRARKSEVDASDPESSEAPLDTGLKGGQSPQIRSADLRMTESRATKLLLAKLSDELGVSFVREVVSKGPPDIRFDAVATALGQNFAVEMGLFRGFPGDPSSTAFISRKFDRVRAFYRTLSKTDRDRFQFIYAAVIEGADAESHAKLEREIDNIARRYPFPTRIEVYELAELENEMGGR